MKTVGIICEYNPFHEGHEYMINELRRGGAESIVCIMSGNAVQRGELAILPKNRRAAAALASGADAVLELPYPWCAASAEFFARAGVYALAALGVDTIAFGSECADAEALSAAARRAARRPRARPRRQASENRAEPRRNPRRARPPRHARRASNAPLSARTNGACQSEFPCRPRQAAA